MADDPTEILPEPEHHRHAQTPPPGATSNRARTVVMIVGGILILVLIGVIIALLVSQQNGGTTPTNPPTSSTPTPTPTETVTPPPLEPSSCTTDTAEASLGEPDGAAGTTTIPLVFTNTSDAPCTLEGFPTVEFVGDGDGTQIGASATEDTETSPVQVITIEPGAAASSILKITAAGNVCEPVDVDGFRVIPPGSSDAFFIATTDYPACDGDVELLTVSAVAAN